MFDKQKLTEAFQANRELLLSLARRMLPPVLLKRLDYDDVLQQVYLESLSRLDYFESEPEVPTYFKLRLILRQTIADLERKHLTAATRSMRQEVDVAEPDLEDRFVAEITSPLSRVDRTERHRLLRAAVASLSETDRQIIVLRHFDGYGNSACAEILGIDPKAASIRHVRALERLELKLRKVSCFRTN